MNTKNFCLVHIPKTGGISIRKAFQKSEYELVSEMHKPYSKYSESKKNSMEFLTVIRNPFDRLYSFYHFFFSEEINRKFLLGLDKEYEISFDDFITQLNLFYPYTLPCWDYITEENESKIQNVLRFENLGNEFQGFCEKFDLKLNLPWEHKNLNKPQVVKSKIYKSYQIKLIEKKYQKDLENFDYSFDSWLDSESTIS